MKITYMSLSSNQNDGPTYLNLTVHRGDLQEIGHFWGKSPLRRARMLNLFLAFLRQYPGAVK